MDEHLATVGKMYEAFGKGDIPALLAHVTDDVRWEQFEDNRAQAAGVLWLQLQVGKAGVAEFFGLLATFNWRDFRVIAMMAGDQRVATELEVEFELPGGATLRDQLMHEFVFNEAGKVTRFRHYCDTAKHIEALRASSLAGAGAEMAR